MIQQRNIKRALWHVVSVVIFFLAIWILRHELNAYHYRDILRQIEAISVPQLLLAVLITALGYLALSGYDLLAVRYAGQTLAYPRIARISFISYAVSNNIPNPLVSGAIRYRLYSAAGFSGIAIGQIIVFNAVTFWLGFLLLGGITFIAEPLSISEAFPLPFVSIHGLGIIFLILLGLYVGATLLHKEKVKIRTWEFSLPSWRLAILQMSISCLDWGLVGTLIYVLLPATGHISYPQFLGIFLFAQMLGFVSQVPAGLGVFETLMLLMLKPAFQADAVLGPLIVYRVLYYLCPLIVAVLLLAFQEIRQRRVALRRTAETVGDWASPVIPHVFALTTFIGGIVLLVSGVTPSAPTRLFWLSKVLPLPVIEVSHFLGSLAGMGLIVLAWGLQRRLDAAYFLTAILLATGSIVSILKGGDYGEAVILALMLLALLPCRQEFHRKAALFEQRFSVSWLLAMGVVLTSSLWLGFFAFKHIEYSHDLWWHFSARGEASRFLRASVGTISLAVFIALFTLIRAVKPKPSALSEYDMDQIGAIIKESPVANAHLALLGDKRFIVSPSGKAFIMYGIEGNSWIAMGDPIGPPEDYRELLWRFREMCDQYGGWPVFYEISHRHLPLYIDHGLALLKLGEEARVPLSAFSLEGSQRKGFRYTVRKLEKEGVTFEILLPDAVTALIPDLRRISDQWLSEKDTHEKQFSLGYFHPPYLAHTPIAVVRQNGKLVAFANLWLAAQHAELSIDLMRYAADAPPSVMEYLFVQLMLWGQQQGYAWFNLGMAPLSGIEDRDPAPLWNRLSTFLYHHGEHFYNFQGLRQYKEKFDPVWESKYLASSGKVAIPMIFANITALNSGGLKGVVSR